jgi:hypothetical protein
VKHSTNSNRPRSAELMQQWYAVYRLGQILMKRYNPRNYALDKSSGLDLIGPFAAPDLLTAREIAKQLSPRRDTK